MQRFLAFTGVCVGVVAELHSTVHADDEVSLIQTAEKLGEGRSGKKKAIKKRDMEDMDMKPGHGKGKPGHGKGGDDHLNSVAQARNASIPVYARQANNSHQCMLGRDPPKPSAGHTIYEYDAICDYTTNGGVSNGLCFGQEDNVGDIDEYRYCLPECGKGVLEVTYDDSGMIHYACACWEPVGSPYLGSPYLLSSAAKSTIYQARVEHQQSFCEGYKCNERIGYDSGRDWTAAGFPFQSQNYYLPDSCPSSSSSHIGE